MKAGPSSRRRNTARINSSRWTLYATAGAATALSCAGSADANIIYSGPIDRSISGRMTVSFPLEGVGNFLNALHHSIGTGLGEGSYGANFLVQSNTPPFQVEQLPGSCLALFYTPRNCARAKRLTIDLFFFVPRFLRAPAFRTLHGTDKQRAFSDFASPVPAGCNTVGRVLGSTVHLSITSPLLTMRLPAPANASGLAKRANPCPTPGAR